ncbi:carbohydrate ABC transporter permease [Pseudonocardia nematodicida]|uniref:Carbohydrate ABC transporter permease n=1 Tax=Pseudonocardia nematodicida TaxID=1206997 RepID=A0ABV1KIH7_9PSEU
MAGLLGVPTPWLVEPVVEAFDLHHRCEGVRIARVHAAEVAARRGGRALGARTGPDVVVQRLVGDLATDAFFIFLMVQFIRGIPRELDQAAWVDGAGPFRVFWYIILPLMRPALITTTIFTFIWTWNDFFSQLIYLTANSVFTVPVALNALVDSESGEGVGTLMAMSLLSLVPILCFFAFAQRYLIRGISTTGLK